MTARTDKKAASIDSRDFKMTFYGILNKDGGFWTPLCFDAEKKAWRHIVSWWGSPTKDEGWARKNFSVVPVRIRLTELSK